MKPLAILVLSSLLAAPAAAALKEGAYELTGYNDSDKAEKTYKGWVFIAKTGKTYKLTWKIGDKQTQRGTALLTGKVLSVAYVDMSGADAGVVSYRVLAGDTLDGLWSPHGAAGAGREVLVWREGVAMDAGSDRL